MREGEKKLKANRFPTGRGYLDIHNRTGNWFLQQASHNGAQDGVGLQKGDRGKHCIF